MPLFGYLSQFYIDSRYDSFMNSLSAEVSSVKAQETLKQTEEVVKRLLSRLT